jgi:tRNA 5-methylaminomethyl-2-thiouridine biosynthesis bifunctional protein
MQWYAGSTFEADPVLHADLAREHATNRRKLRALLPEAAQTLGVQFDQGQVRAWQGTRCITHDRLPLVGRLEIGPSPSLWLCAGMGARGLSFSALCAELLAAKLGAEPLPVESNLAKLLSTTRTRRKGT